MDRNKELEKLLSLQSMMGGIDTPQDIPMAAGESLPDQVNDIVENPYIQPKEEQPVAEAPALAPENDPTKIPTDSDVGNKRVSLEDLKKQYMELLQAQKKARDEADARDRESEFTNQMLQAGALGNRALASQAGYSVDKSAPIQLPTGELKKVQGMQAQDLKSIMDQYKMLSGGTDLSPYQKANLDLQRERLGLQKDKEGRLVKKTDKAIEKQEELSDKEVEKVTAFDTGAQILTDIDSLVSTTNVEDMIGPYASRIENAKSAVPYMEKNENFVKVQQLVGTQLADYVKSISGAQVSEEEAQRLLKNIPSVDDKPKEFKTKLKEFRKLLGMYREKYVSNIGKQKEGAKKFEKKASANEVKRKTKDGKTAIFNADTKEFIRYEE